MRQVRQPSILVLLVALCGGPLAAQERPAEEAPPQQRTHVVRKGDTLWDLARQYLSNPFQWPRIFDANRAVIRDPHWIYPEQRFVIPPVVADVVSVGEPGAEAGQPVSGAEGARPVALGVTAARAPRRTLFYRGQQEQVLAEPTGQEIEVREREALLQVQPIESAAAAWLADEDELPVYGEVVEEVGGRKEGDRLEYSMHPMERVYVRYEDDEVRPEVGQRLLLVAVGRGAGEWGRVIEPTAIATVLELADEVMVVQLTRQFGPVHAGNLALPLEEFAGAPAAQVVVADGPEGEIIDFRTPQPQPSVADQAFVNLGRAHGIDVGDELVAYRPERQSADGSALLPAEVVARMTVVRVQEESATVRVVALSVPALEPGLPVRLVRATR